MVDNNGDWIDASAENSAYGGDLYDNGVCITYIIPKIYKKSKSIKVKILASKNPHFPSYDTEVDSFSIIYRERGNA